MSECFSKCAHCGGEAFDDDRCLAHLEKDSLERALKRVERGEVLRGRGVELSGQRWALIRARLPGGEAERPSVRNAVLCGARFGDGCSFAGLALEGARFSEAVFGTDVTFNGASFGDGADFESTSFGDRVIFSRASFGDRACFDGSSFGHEADFSQASFGDEATFSGSAIEETEVRFGDKASFSGTSFGRAASFYLARFGPEADFSGCAFGESASFWKARFGDGTRFSGCSFGDGSSFDDSAFGDGAVFAGSCWGDDVRLIGATFGGAASFLGANFGDRARLDGVVFGDGPTLRASFGTGARLTGARVGERADLCAATFGSAASFEGASFGDGAEFKQAAFGDRVDFSRASFGDDSAFGRARFGEEADFSEAEFAGPARFARARFAGDVDFTQAHFGGEVTFFRVRFAGEVDLLGVHFDQDADLSHTRFSEFVGVGPFATAGRASFEHAEFNSTARIQVVTPMLDLSGAVFRGPLNVEARFATVLLDRTAFEGPVALVGVDPFSSPVYGELDEGGVREAAKRLGDLGERPRLLRLHGVDVSRMELSRVDLENCLFVGARNLGALRFDQTVLRETPVRRFRGRQASAIADEHLWRWRNQDRGWRPPCLPAGEEAQLETRSYPQEIVEAYQGLRRAREAVGDTPGANELYYGEMEMRRAVASPAGRLALGVYRELAGYDVRPTRPLLALGLVILACALLLQLLGEADGANLGETILFCARSALLQPSGGIADPGAVAEVVETVLRVVGPILLAFTGITGLRTRLRR